MVRQERIKLDVFCRTQQTFLTAEREMLDNQTPERRVLIKLISQVLQENSISQEGQEGILECI